MSFSTSGKEYKISEVVTKPLSFPFKINVWSFSEEKMFLGLAAGRRFFFLVFFIFLLAFLLFSCFFLFFLGFFGAFFPLVFFLFLVFFCRWTCPPELRLRRT